MTSNLNRLTHFIATSNVQIPLKETPSQTAGPYFHVGCLPNNVNIKGTFKRDLTTNKHFIDDRVVEIFGYIFQGNNEKVNDAMIECWQADKWGNMAEGIWQRSSTNLNTGKYKFQTIIPGRVKEKAPCLNLWIVARGINLGLHTKMFFEDHENDADPILGLVPSHRRSTLIAKKTKQGYRFDIHLQGENETIFFNE